MNLILKISHFNLSGFFQPVRLADLVNTLLGVVFSLTALAGLGQTQNDTIWGTGLFSVIDENFTAIQNENILCTPLQMQGDTIPDTTYTFTTNNGGEAFFELPVYIDLGTRINEHKSIDALVAPNPSSDFTFAFHGKPTSDLHIYNLLGQEVKNS